MTTKFTVQIFSCTDFGRFASVRHNATGTGCDFYQDGTEQDWQDNNGLIINHPELADEAREIAKKALKA